MKYKASLRGNVLGIISLPSERAMYAETHSAHASFSCFKCCCGSDVTAMAKAAMAEGRDGRSLDL